jgi:hypothetical protein
VPANTERQRSRTPPRTCAVCGRRIEWRRAWADSWDQVRYCSHRCRRRGRKPVDDALEAAIVDLLDRRPGGATICPSEAARVVGGEDWRLLMQDVRSAARRLVAAGKIEITQRGRPVDPSEAKGPIRLRRR